MQSSKSSKWRLIVHQFATGRQRQPRGAPGRVSSLELSFVSLEKSWRQRTAPLAWSPTARVLVQTIVHVHKENQFGFTVCYDTATGLALIL